MKFQRRVNKKKKFKIKKSKYFFIISLIIRVIDTPDIKNKIF